ncbi:MAG: peptide deformylase [Clostridia bacterium]|nr:peptide deformylase [Clostridia bacterium]MBQ7224568.1 peptide deformylase [Clostridia bacterium]MBR6773383.1 peptide deformylase [Clostridia bacterium]MBR7141120.1 peptide deformylase [Clostridia bacterium]
MALRNIVTIPNNLLREKSREVTEFNESLGQLIDDMIDTMFRADGVGLAAPQVGILRRICVVCVDGKTVYELVNPVIVKQSGEQVGPEGCLSVPGRHGIVCRPRKIVVEAQDRTGKKHTYKLEGFIAVAFCHEIDHLDGTLYIDKVIEEA